MRNQSLYLTLAQVLPTLLIAVVIELRAIIGAYGQRTQLPTPEEMDAMGGGRHPVVRGRIEDGRRYASVKLNRYVSVYVAVSLTFFVGEAATLAGSIVGLDGWLAWVLGPIALLAVVGLAGFAVFLPLQALRAEAKIVHRSEEGLWTGPRGR